MEFGKKNLRTYRHMRCVFFFILFSAREPFVTCVCYPAIPDLKSSNCIVSLHYSFLYASAKNDIFFLVYTIHRSFADCITPTREIPPLNLTSIHLYLSVCGFEFYVNHFQKRKNKKEKTFWDYMPRVILVFCAVPFSNNFLKDTTNSSVSNFLSGTIG